MGIFGNLFLSVVHLLLVALDIAAFFLMIKLFYWRWPKPWLLPWDKLGSPITDGLARPFQVIRIGQREICQPPLSWIFCIVAIIILRFILTTTLR